MTVRYRMNTIRLRAFTLVELLVVIAHYRSAGRLAFACCSSGSRGCSENSVCKQR